MPVCDRCKTRPADEPTISRMTRRSTGEPVDLCFPCQEHFRDRMLSRLGVLSSRPHPQVHPGQLALDLSEEGGA